MAKRERNAGAGSAIERLRGLPAGSAEQIDAALGLVGTATRTDLLQAALDVLADYAEDDPRPRPALLARYADYGAGARRDTGGFERAALLRALRPVARGEDAALLERAVLTYEFIPPFAGPTEGEVAAGLRSVALVALNTVDETLAGYHAARLLIDRYTSDMSGEPAVTAARVLAAQGRPLPLYGYLLRDREAGLGVAEVVAECLRGLEKAPASALRPLVERYLGSGDEFVLLGLFDLLLARADRTAFDDDIVGFARATRLYNVYRYLVSAIVAGRDDALIDRLAGLAADEEDRLKAEILDEALALR